jgi:hypothetical protein
LYNISVHIYYNNNSLSSTWPAKFLAVPQVGDTVYFKSGSQDGEEEWVVEKVIHYPLEPMDEEEGLAKLAGISVHMRPAGTEKPAWR